MTERPPRATVGRPDAAGQALSQEPTSERQITAAFGEYLARELRARNWTIWALATRSGVDHTTISRLIRGQRVPTLRTASRLNEALEGPDPGPVPTVTTDSVPNDPVQRVADALGADPTLEDAARTAILAFYIELRLSGRRAAGLPPDD